MIDQGREQDERWAEAVRARLGDPALLFAADLEAFAEIFAGRPAAADPPAVWRPLLEGAAASNLG